MAELTTLARPYAKAAFEFARIGKGLKSWQQALYQTAVVSMHDDVKAVLASPNLTTAQKGTVFCELCASVLDDKQKNFMMILAENGRLDLLPEVYELFELYKANQEKTVDVEILTAFDISGGLQRKLAKTLKEKLDRDVDLTTTIDESLIGGALIRAGDTVIDGSARGRLAKLAEAMNA